MCDEYDYSRRFVCLIIYYLDVCTGDFFRIINSGGEECGTFFTWEYISEIVIVLVCWFVLFLTTGSF